MKELPKNFNRILQVIQSPYFLIVWIMLIAISYFYIDKPVATYFFQLRDTQLKEVAEFITQFGEGTFYIIAFAMLLLISRFFIKNQKLTKRYLFLLLAILIPGAICLISKIVLGRIRPIIWFNYDTYGFTFFQFHSPFWSFPSGHATTSIAVMIGLSLVWPRYWVSIFTVFLLITFTRIIITAHFLSDILAGMYLAAIVVITLYNHQHKLLSESSL